MPDCNGICIEANDLIVGYPGVVAYPHPECPLHAPDAFSDEFYVEHPEYVKP